MYHIHYSKTLVMIILTAALVFWSSAALGGAKSLKVGQPAPDIAWLGVDGAMHTWQELRNGRPMVVVFWGTWCSVCENSWPKLKEVERDFASAELSPLWVSVAVLDTPEQTLRVSAELGLPGVQLCDPDESNFSALKLKYVPTVCVLDQDGTVVYVGEPKLGKIRKLIAELSAGS